MIGTLPYVNSYGRIPRLFEAIAKATVPPKVTQDYVYSILGLKSTSDRAMIPLLKRLGFLDQSNVPTQHYRDYRDSSKSESVMATCIKNSYQPLFAAHEYVYKLSKTELTTKVKSVTGLADNDQILTYTVGTFIQLCKLADFEAKQIVQAKPKEETKETPTKISPIKLGVSYTINLNLPATTEIEVFNVIFKSLKEHILSED